MKVAGQLLQAGQHTFCLHQARTDPAGPVLIRFQTLQLFFAFLRRHVPGCRVGQGERFTEQGMRQPQGGHLRPKLNRHLQQLAVALRVRRRRVGQLQYGATETLAQQVADATHHCGDHHFQVGFANITQWHTFQQAETHPFRGRLNTRYTQPGTGAEITLQQTQGIAEVGAADRRIPQQAVGGQRQLLPQGQAQCRITGHLPGPNHHPAELLETQRRLRVINFFFR